VTAAGRVGLWKVLGKLFCKANNNQAAGFGLPLDFTRGWVQPVSQIYAYLCLNVIFWGILISSVIEIKNTQNLQPINSPGKAHKGIIQPLFEKSGATLEIIKIIADATKTPGPI
jgi:hypothetical protein